LGRGRKLEEGKVRNRMGREEGEEKGRKGRKWDRRDGGEGKRNERKGRGYCNLLRIKNEKLREYYHFTS
jgi:hypothetical protein